MVWTRTSHCSWDCGDFRIVKEYCPRRGGITFKLFDGEVVTYHATFDDAHMHLINKTKNLELAT